MPVADQGVDPTRYMLIPRVLVFITCEDQVLLLKGAPTKKIWPDLYNGIGGHIERGEDVLAAARRELREETGILDADLWLCGVITVDTGENPGIGIFVVKGDCIQQELTCSSEGTPHWVTYPQVLNLPLVEDLYALLPRIFAAQRNMLPFVARTSYNEEDQLIIEFIE